MSALLKAFESLGHKISSGPKIEVNGQAVTLTIREATKTVEEEFEASKESITGHYDFFSERKRKKQVPSGLLTVLVPEADNISRCNSRSQPKVNGASLWLGLLNKYFSVTRSIDSNSASLSCRRVLMDLIFKPDPSKGVSSSLPAEPNGFTKGYR